ncbi:MAG TPA: ABC transporter substrate-binding protein [Nocardioides sp.]|uniref:ABC transporter substrate-binding protein n=1 Tax=uncultured Nocardioides sp. TaxID=198441 RepID=UPI002610AAE2|nr:ABC transporter substrate-binding protein [uncultured Nocardioides sp.]HRD63526.1 ABC transporter substrate-binding protein [Nocardioides sp.]HRI97119.1 ABC transporter substrate-binding protein [Nocardioides sp.]
MAVTHKYGETTVDEEPVRVVSVGVTEQDILMQLGVVPVGVTEWYGEQPFATWPWAQELLGDAEPEVLSTADGFEMERIAALQPDLIVGTNSGMSKKEYELFSQIAPTIPAVEGSTPYFSPWRDQTVQIAKALGKEAEGQAIVDEIDGRYAEVAAAHPEWADMTATFSQGGPYDGLLYVYPPGLSTDFLTDLGFTITTGFESFAPEVGSQAEISAENVSLIDADVIVFATESADMFDDLQGFGTIGNLAAVAENRAVYTDETLAGAIYFDTPLAHACILDHLVPTLELAATGEAPRAYPS